MTKEAYLSSLVPRMYKSEFDDKAAEILAEHCPEALEKPMPVPIEEIARDKLHLLIKEYHLSEDLSILGQMCFTDGLVEIYDPSEDEYREVFVKAKTMIIDPDTYLKRNFGSRRNTVAHECVHWIYHRNYFLAMEALKEGRAVTVPVSPLPTVKMNARWWRIMTETIKDQILAIRDTGLTNMFDVNAVQRLAYERDFYELVVYLEENRKEYVHFILTGEA